MILMLLLTIRCFAGAPLRDDNTAELRCSNREGVRAVAVILVAARQRFTLAVREKCRRCGDKAGENGNRHMMVFMPRYAIYARAGGEREAKVYICVRRCYACAPARGALLLVQYPQNPTSMMMKNMRCAYARYERRTYAYSGAIRRSKGKMVSALLFVMPTRAAICAAHHAGRR